MMLSVLRLYSVTCRMSDKGFGGGGGSGHGQKKTQTWHMSGETAKSWGTSIRIAGVLVEIQTKPFLNKSVKLYLYTSLFSNDINMHL
jgi:hypothetical protein